MSSMRWGFLLGRIGGVGGRLKVVPISPISGDRVGL